MYIYIYSHSWFIHHDWDICHEEVVFFCVFDVLPAGHPLRRQCGRDGLLGNCKKCGAWNMDGTRVAQKMASKWQVKR